ncbi:MAG: hypothetical protein LQ346_003517, partial [Caloplaca aetnensis]
LYAAIEAQWELPTGSQDQYRLGGTVANTPTSGSASSSASQRELLQGPLPSNSLCSGCEWSGNLEFPSGLGCADPADITEEEEYGPSEKEYLARKRRAANRDTAEWVAPSELRRSERQKKGDVDYSEPKQKFIKRNASSRKVPTNRPLTDIAQMPPTPSSGSLQKGPIKAAISRYQQSLAAVPRKNLEDKILPIVSKMMDRNTSIRIAEHLLELIL